MPETQSAQVITLKVYDDAFKIFLEVKVLDDDVFPIIKSHCIFLFLCVLTWSLLGADKKPEPHPDWSLLAFNLKFAMSIPYLFIWEFPPTWVSHNADTLPKLNGTLCDSSASYSESHYAVALDMYALDTS